MTAATATKNPLKRFQYDSAKGREAGLKSDALARAEKAILDSFLHSGQAGQEGATVGDKTKTKLGILLSFIVQKTRKLPEPKTLNDFRTIVSMAEVVFGWGGKNAPSLHLHNHSTSKLIEAPQPVVSCGVEQSKAIDITPQDSVSH